MLRGWPSVAVAARGLPVPLARPAGVFALSGATTSMARLTAARQHKAAQPRLPSPYPWPCLSLPACVVPLLAPVGCPLMPGPCAGDALAMGWDNPEPNRRPIHGTEPASHLERYSGPGPVPARARNPSRALFVAVSLRFRFRFAAGAEAPPPLARWAIRNRHRQSPGQGAGHGG